MKFLRVLKWKASNFLLGGIFPGITISRIKNGELDLRLRADGLVVITDKQGTQDGLYIHMINTDLAIELANAQQWPWETPVTIKDLEAAQ